MAFTAPTEGATLDVVYLRLSKFTGGNGLLATRAQGEEARAAVHWELLSSADYAPVVIEVQDIEAMSFPFADSFFPLLLRGWVAGYYDERALAVVGANQTVAETIDAVVRLHKLGVLTRRQDGRAELLGGEPALREAVAAATTLDRRFSAAELGEALGITPQAVNNRLKTLLHMGAVLRAPTVVRGGGREFVYELSDVYDENFDAERAARVKLV
jgi:hypothetical protein